MSADNRSFEFPKPEKEALSVTQSLKGNDCSIQYGSTSDAATLLDPKLESASRCAKIYKYLTTMTIEPVMFCYMAGFFMNMSILTSFMMDIACTKRLNYSSEICTNLSFYEKEKDEVELIGTDFTLYSNVLNLVGAFLMIFIAPWSDRYGRKPPLIGVGIGCILTDAGYILCTIYDARLEYLLLAKIPSELFGGFICVMAIIYSHASEVSTEKNRTLKYTSVEIAMGLGMALGRLSGGLLKRYYGYLYVYVTVEILHVFCLLWVALVVQETVGLDGVAKWSEKMKNFFECRSFKNGVQTTFRVRERNDRTVILLLIISMCVNVLTYESFGNIGFVYLHNIYDWDVTIYNIVQTIFSLIQMAVALLVVPLLVKVFKMNDFMLGIIGAASMIAKNFITAFSKSHVFVYYLSQSAGLLGPLNILAIRSGLSKIVEKDELGKVFSFLATCESILPMLGTILLTKIFEATLESYPNCTYSMASVCLLVPMATFIWALANSKRTYESRILDEDHI